MKYRQYYSRYISERKRKAKSAYMSKVMAGVALSLAMSASTFIIVSADTDTLDAALGEENPENSGLYGTGKTGKTAETKVSLDQLLNGGSLNDGGDSGFILDDLEPGTVVSPAAILDALLEKYGRSVKEYTDALKKYESGKITSGELQTEYAAYRAERDKASDAYDTALSVYNAEKDEYEALWAQYEKDLQKYYNEYPDEDQYSGLAAYKAELKEALDTNAKATSDYAKAMADYGLAMLKYKTALEKWEMAFVEPETTSL